MILVDEIAQFLKSRHFLKIMEQVSDFYSLIGFLLHPLHHFYLLSQPFSSKFFASIADVSSFHFVFGLPVFLLFRLSFLSSHTIEYLCALYFFDDSLFFFHIVSNYFFTVQRCLQHQFSIAIILRLSFLSFFRNTIELKSFSCFSQGIYLSFLH